MTWYKMIFYSDKLEVCKKLVAINSWVGLMLMFSPDVNTLFDKIC